MKTPPKALRDRGLERAGDNAGDQEVRFSRGAMWRRFGADLERHFRRQPAAADRRSKP